MPYSAKETRTDIKNKTDGTTMDYAQEQLVWRDADGRTRNEMIWTKPPGEEWKRHFVTVYDPVQRVHWTWHTGGSSAKGTHMKPFLEREQSPRCPAPPSLQATIKPDDFTVEFLPPTTINGIPVVVNRNTKVVPAGKTGNDHEFTITQEWWISTDLGIVMRRMREDPSGKIIVELSDVNRSAPAPALFRVPEGYEVREDPPPKPTVLDQILRDVTPVMPATPPK
ncbi:MAG: hypothetical protein WBV46_13930 [Terriglobales bacterium]